MRNIKELLKNYNNNIIYLKQLNDDCQKSENYRNLCINNFSYMGNKQLSRYLDELKNEIEFVDEMLQSLNPPMRNVLYFKYVKNHSYQDISLKMNYSIARIYQLHKEAIIILEENYKEK